MNIVIASDHAGYKAKQKIIKKLKDMNMTDLGTTSIESVDYPDYALKVGNTIIKKEADLGILICGTGIGMSIAANKIKGIRCAKVDNVKEAYLARVHNDANVIAISSKNKNIIKIVKKFINTNEKIEERHLRRIKKVEEIG